MDGHKRKRDDEGTVVTFHAPHKTFARVYKGQSLGEVNDIVRRKLGLSGDASIRFARLHEGKVIELDDDDDFEAFQHLARYVTSLDVSVFVGQDGPPIVTEQNSQGAPVSSRNNRKRPKKYASPILSSAVSPHAESTPKSPSAEQPSRLPTEAATVDGNGVPKKKRYRRSNGTLTGGSRAALTVERPVRKELAKDQERSTQPVHLVSASGVASSSTDHVAHSLTDDGAPHRVSKRKRRDSSETSIGATPNLPIPVVSSSFSPPCLPTKNKRKKGWAVGDSVTPVMEVMTSQHSISDKTGKRKGRDVTESFEPLEPAHTTASQNVVAEGASDVKESIKKAKKDTRKEAERPPAPETDPTTLGTAKRSKKRKHKDAPIGEIVETLQAPPESIRDVTSHSRVHTDQQEQAVESEKDEALPSVLTSSVIPSDVAGDPSPSGEIPRPDTVQVEPEVASAKKAKRDRKKSLPASSEDSSGLSPAAMAALHAAFDAVMARGPLASTAGSIPPVPIPVPASPILGRKRNAGKSKLHKVWGPDDLTDNLPSDASASPSTAIQSVSTASEPTPMVDTTAQPQAKAANPKKARPSSTPLCPVCEKAAVHSRSECPIVTAGAPSLRKRIAQLKKAGGSSGFIGELEVLLEVVQKRRRTTAAAPSLPHLSTPSATIPLGDITPSSPELTLQSLSAPRRPSLPRRSLSGPRLPAGSEISEVAVEGKDEGSSNESSTSDDDDDAQAPAHLASAIIPDQTDLEALLWRPVKPRSSILAQLPSSSSSSSDTESEESDDNAEKDEDVDLEEEDKNDRAFRRMSRKLERAASSSEDEREPEAEPANPDVDLDDIIIPPTMMDPDPNNSVEDAREVEMDVLARPDLEFLGGTIGSDKWETDEEKGEAELAEEEMREMLDDPEADDDEPGEEGAIPASQREGSAPSESGESPARSGPDGLSINRGNADRVERAVEVDPLVSQETLNATPEDMEPVQPQEAEDEQEESDDDAAPGKGQPRHSPGNDHPEIARKDPVADIIDDPEEYQDRELPPELGDVLPMSPAHVSLVEDDEDDATAVQVDVVEPHSEDPDDPIESFNSVGDREHHDSLEAESSIDDPDVSQREVERRIQTPPPATPRTPGTVSRMKDRYGRLPQARARDSAPPLSRQFLGDLVLFEAELTLTVDTGEPAHGQEPEPEHGLGEGEEVEEGEDRKEHEEAREVDCEDDEALRAESEKIRDSRESSQVQQDAVETEARPRRTTRATRRTSTMPPPSSLLEPTSTPTPAPPQRGRKRLSEEEKARREAEKLEKKAERERKAAEKKAEQEAKAAAKRADTEARKAAKLAEKEAKSAAQRALQEEVAKRGARATTGRGQRRGAKSMSTQTQRPASVDEPEEEEDVHQPQGQEGDLQAFQKVTETPAVGRISWATLSQSGPRTQTESVGDVDSSMIDELQPSSPELAPERRARGRKKIDSKNESGTGKPADELIDQDRSLDVVTPKPKGAKEPLFVPFSSQDRTRIGLPDAESTPFVNNDPHGSESQAEQDLERTLKGSSRSRPSWFSQAMYPTLTDLATQQLFPDTQIPSPALFLQTPNINASQNVVAAQYGKGRDDEDEDESSEEEEEEESDSSDNEKITQKSHIPHNRRAGVGVQKKKKTGLLSTYK